MTDISDEFEEIPAFHSPWHYEKFEKSINDMISSGMVKEVAVAEKYSVVQGKEKWIQCPNGAIWRLVEPDFPFAGCFEPVGKFKQT